jgi:MFS family permease
MATPPIPPIPDIYHPAPTRKLSSAQRFPARDLPSRPSWQDIDFEKAAERQNEEPPFFDIDIVARELAARERVEAMKLDLRGWRLVVIMLSIFTGLFLSFLDTSIVAVALATIASKFNSFANSSWVFTAYLLTYMAFGIILARLSDIFGLRIIEAMSMLLFLIFSAACGGARSMTQLIIFRSIQGIGGSGLYSMCTIISLAAVPASKIGEMATYVSLTQAVAVVLGPILGGVITQHVDSDNWRWIFYINLPLSALALIGLMVAWPRRTRGQDGRPYRISFKSIEQIDFMGCSLLLIASVMLIFGLQEAGARVYRWESPSIVSSFWICGIAFVGFLAWEYYLEMRTSDWNLKPILPVTIAGKRVMLCAIM